MRKLLIGVLLVVLLSGSVWAGDSLLVVIRAAKNNVGEITTVPDTVWNQWANDAYQSCLTDGFAWIREDLVYVNPYVFPDSDNYALPIDFYVWIGAEVITGGDEHNVKLVLPGQELEIGLGRTGKIDFCKISDDSIRFYPNAAKRDTVLLTYYSLDSIKADSDVVNIPRAYTPIMADYVCSQYYNRMQNQALSNYYMQSFWARLDKRTQLRRAIKADIIIQQKPMER